MQVRQMARCWLSIIITLLITAPQWAAADVVRVAVASNFLAPLQEVAIAFEKASGHTVKLSGASTGKLYAQISNGAPFDIFFSADAERPELIARERNNGQQAKTYAYGRLVFIAYTDADAINTSTCIDRLSSSSVKRIAIANPMTAPYGLAAKKTLEALGLWQQVKDKIVMGENITQTLHFVDSQNAQAGFLAKSQLINYQIKNTCQWDVPEQYHDKIVQKMLKLRADKYSVAVDAFWDFLRSQQVSNIIKAYGYDIPNDDLPSYDASSI